MVDCGVDGKHISNLDRADECHRLNGDRDDAPLSLLGRANAPSLIHLADHPAAENIAVGVGVARHSDQANRQFAARRGSSDCNVASIAAPFSLRRVDAATTRSRPARSLPIPASTKPHVSRSRARRRPGLRRFRPSARPLRRAGAATPAGFVGRRQGRQFRHRAQAADRSCGPRAAVSRVRASEHRADLTRSGQTARRDPSSSRQHESRPAAASPQASTLRRATLAAAAEMSTPTPCAWTNSTSKEHRSAPEPTPRSSTRNGSSRRPPSSLRAISTIVSVSGRGSRTCGRNRER